MSSDINGITLLVVMPDGKTTTLRNIKPDCTVEELPVLLRCVDDGADVDTAFDADTDEETDAATDTATEGPTPADSETIDQAGAPATHGGGDTSAAGGVALASVLARYEQVGLRTKPSKVRDYDAVQDLLGYTLDHNVLRGSCSRYAAIRAEVLRITRCGWARPREVERLVGKITHWLLLHRPSLALLNAVYAFCHTDSPERPRRLWRSTRAVWNWLRQCRSQFQMQENMP